MNDISPLDTAIIGMACYFPEADNLEEYWNNLSKGICSVKSYTDRELLDRGVDKNLLNHPDYVKTSPFFSRTRFFDASFFNVNPGEANIMDPQRRLFIENCWQALEDAGYVPEKYPGKIGVFGSTGIIFYLNNLIDNPEIINTVGPLQLISANDKDGLPTQTSYLLNLTGPSININTSCSSALVAIHLARHSLIMGDSDMVLAGGSALIIPENVGYIYERGSITSNDGYCRAFDDAASGTIWGSGSGVVLLKRLSDAIADGDNIRAVIKGSAINNDGSNKVGYTAPSIEGQSEIIVQAYASSGISPESINFIEAHGTGTKIGDPIEVAALTKAFREYTNNKRFCGLGSVKTNFGHLGAAAGIASFIKVVLALENKQVPPSLHFIKGNRNIDFENSPFYVNTELRDMERKASPLRAGVSSLGVGGTNAHLILEEAPEEYVKSRTTRDKESIILLSARNSRQLEQMKDNLLKYMEKNDTKSIVDIAYTLQKGRSDFKNKIAFKADSVAYAIDILNGNQPEKVISEENFPGGIGNNGNEFDMKLNKWFRGEAVDWESLYKDGKPRRVSLPAYPFEKDEYWIEPNRKNAITMKEEDDTLAHRNDNMQDWFYYSSWAQTSLPPAPKDDPYKPLKRLIFVDNFKFGRQLGDRLKDKGDKVIFVYPGKKYEKKKDGSYEINLDDPNSYQLLMKDLKDNELAPDSILHFFGINKSSQGNYISRLKSIFSFQKYGIFSFLHLIKAINKNNITNKINLTAFAGNVYDIGDNEIVFPEKSAILSVMKVIQQEYPNFLNRVIEFNSNFLEHKDCHELMINELMSKNTDIVCAYRGKKRFVLNYHPVKLEGKTGQTSVFKKNGVYFVFGGLTGGMPLLYEYIIKQYRARLIILDDPYFIREKEWDKWLSEHNSNEINSLKIKTVKKLKAMDAEYIDGIDVVYGRKKLEKKIKELENRLGPINGIIHAAGGYAAGRIAPLSVSEDDLKHLSYYNLASISASFVVLNEIFKNRKLDFRYLWTSLSTVLAGSTFFSYCAADSILMNTALKANKSLAGTWTIFNWDSLESEWFEELIEENMAQVYDIMKERISEGLITTKESAECLEMLSSAGTQFNPIIISCSDLLKRYNIWIKMEQIRNFDTEYNKGIKKKNLKPRPNLPTPYEAPISEMERMIVDVIEQVISIEKIGRKDNFFDLGVDSLVSIQFAAKIRELAQIDIGMEKFQEYQTVADISGYIMNAKQEKIEEK